MRVLNQEPLAPRTSFHIGGRATRLLELETEHEAIDAIRSADAAGESFCLLAGGSNVVVADEGIDHPVFQLRLRGIQCVRHSEHVDMTAAAGEPWDDLVARCVDEGLAGVECLSGIPGHTGAAPIQNIGAYGQDLSQTLVAVRAFDRQRDRVVEIPAADCAFAYRQSLFKRSDAIRRYIVLGLTLRLRRGAPASIRYDELHQALAPGPTPPSVQQIRAAVLQLRRTKGMVLDEADPDSRGAGSFFLNPIVSAKRADEIELRAKTSGLLASDQSLPRFSTASVDVKISAAWLVERSGFRRGHRHGGAAISTKHALALINRANASARDVLGLAHAIRTAVLERFGIELVPEPAFVGFEPDPTGLHGRLPVDSAT